MSAHAELPWERVWSAAGERLQVQRSEVGGKPIHRFVSNGEGDGAVVVARDGARVLFVQIDRPVTGRTLWELPRGQAERGDGGALGTAARELLEEAGHELRDAVVLGQVWADTGLCGDAVNVVIGTAQARPDVVPEFGVQAWLDADQIARAVADGRIRDGLSLAALALARATGALAG